MADETQVEETQNATKVDVVAPGPIEAPAQASKLAPVGQAGQVDAADPTPAPVPTPVLGQVDAAVHEAVARVEKAAADDYAAALKALPNVPEAIHSLISGETVAAVKAAYEQALVTVDGIKAYVLAELGAAVPGAHGTQGAPPPPATAFDMISVGLAQAGKQ